MHLSSVPNLLPFLPYAFEHTKVNPGSWGMGLHKGTSTWKRESLAPANILSHGCGPIPVSQLYRVHLNVLGLLCWHFTSHSWIHKEDRELYPA